MVYGVIGKIQILSGITYDFLHILSFYCFYVFFIILLDVL